VGFAGTRGCARPSSSGTWVVSSTRSVKPAKRKVKVSERSRQDPLRRVVDRHLPRAKPAKAAPRARRRRKDARSAGSQHAQFALRLLRTLGPGVITGASDDDPSGIATYSQAGSQFGFATLWTALLTFPFMLAVQDTCARIALYTGAGLATNLRRRFPTSLVALCVLALVIANTINLGADIQAVAVGVSLLTNGVVQPGWLVAPVTAGLLAMLVRLKYASVVRIFKLLTLALFAYVATAVIVRPPVLTTLHATFVPHVELTGSFIGIIVAIFGTTISPYLFFWQASSEVDQLREKATTSHRTTPSQRAVRASRADVLVGMLFSQVVMYCIILATAAVLHGHGTTVQSATQAAKALAPVAGSFASVIFAVGLVGAGFLAIPVLAGSAAYAVEEFLGLRGSLRDTARQSPTLYAVMGAAMAGGLTLTVLHINPIQALVVTAIVNGVAAPPILALIAILARDAKVMGDQRSGTLRHLLLWTITVVMTVAAVALVVTTIWAS